MILPLLVAAYVAVVVVSFLATALSFLRPQSLWHRRRHWVRLATAAEVVYMLQAPACVYLPRVPGRPAVQRRILGADAAGHVYWLESTAPMAFLWGPRWWVSFRGEITLIPFLPYDGGLDWIRPLRYAAWKAAHWDVATDDGRRWPIPDRRGSRGTMATGVLRTVSTDGMVLELRDSGLVRLRPGATSWECVPPCELPVLGFRRGLAATASGAIWEVFEPGNAGQVLTRQHAGERLLQFRLRSSAPDAAPRVFELSLSQRPVTAGPSAAQAIAGNGLALFLSTWDGEGAVYRISSTPPGFLQLASFRFDHHKAAAREHTAAAFFAMTADETLFTTGQAIWDVAGTILQDVDPPLESAVWVGHTLHGVRTYPFFGHRYLARNANRSRILSYAASGLIRDDERNYRVAAEGLRKSAWVIGGVDESGREDELVHLSMGEVGR